MASSGPLPGTKTSTKLSKDDLKSVLSELILIKEKWYYLGLELDVPADELDKIESGCSNDLTTCLRKMLTKCLESGKADWRLLCEALRRPLVLGEGAGLARTLMKKYCQAKDGHTKDGHAKDGHAKDGQPKAKDSPAKDKKEAKKRKKSGDMPGPVIKKPRVIESVIIDDSDEEKESEKLVQAPPKRFDPVKDFARTQGIDRLCSKCKMVPHTPQRLQCCKRLYCEVCVGKLTECGDCKKLVFFQKDQELYSKIQKVTIKCPNRSKGCTWTGLMLSLKKHLPECSAINDGKERSKETPQTAQMEGTSNTPQGQSSKAKEHPASKQHPALRQQPASKEDPLSKEQQTSSPKPKPMQASPARKVDNTPPLNIVMQNVSGHKHSGETWYSDTFLSHQLGYKLNLAVKVEKGLKEDTRKLSIALVPSKEGRSDAYLDYENAGDCTVTIMNPVANEHHEVVEFMFTLNNKDLTRFSREVEISHRYITKDCLFFRAVKVDIKDTKSWLLDPMVPLKD